MIEQSRFRLAHILSVLIATLVVIAAGGGLLMPGLYERVAPDFLAPRAHGHDLVSLLMTPILMLSLVLATRGSLRALFIWLGLLGFFFYNYAVYAFDDLYTPFFLIYITLVGLPVFCLLAVLCNLDVVRLRSSLRRKMPVKAASIYFTVSALSLALLRLVRLTDGIILQETRQETAVIVLDLALLLPALLIAALWFWRRRTWGYVWAAILLVISVALGASTLAGELFAYLSGFALDWGVVGFFLPFTLAGFLLTGFYYNNIHEDGLD